MKYLNKQDKIVWGWDPNKSKKKSKSTSEVKARMKRGFKVMWEGTKKGYNKLANSRFVANQRAMSNSGGNDFDFSGFGGNGYEFSTDLGFSGSSGKKRKKSSNINPFATQL
jgi:predicted glycosyltransferase involved in capsule biosynthesis